MFNFFQDAIWLRWTHEIDFESICFKHLCDEYVNILNELSISTIGLFWNICTSILHVYMYRYML